MADEMEAGRAFDLWIAERVMGWRRGGTQYGNMLVDETGLHVAPLTGSIRGDLPAYSTDIKDAWVVVEHLRQKGWVVRVQEMPDGFPFLLGSGWEKEPSPELHRRALCSLYPTPALEQSVGLGRTIDAFANTSPLAVCKAAYKACGAGTAEVLPSSPQ